MKKGMFVMVDGLDGSGKGVAVTGLREYAESKGMKALDLREYWKKNEGFPDISGFDVIISAEPTFTGMGKKIREEIIKNGTKYTSKETAEAFSKDREELYRKVIIPALEQGKWVFQERGVVTSLVYQPLMDESISLDFVLSLPGNKLCLDHPPDLLAITVIDPEIAMERLGRRKEKADDAVFEKLRFQRKIKNVYESKWLKGLFGKKGSKVVYISTNPPSTEADTKKKIVKAFEEIVRV